MQFPFSKPFYVMAKPAGATCNLACEYCYYLEKLGFYPDKNERMMTDDLLEQFIKEYISSQTTPDVLFTWHGGEPLMRPIAFYKRALKLQRMYANGRHIDNCIQTNGTLITEEWCRFFRKNGFLVGVSIDGEQDFHDAYRRNKSGLPSYHKVMQGLRLLNRYGVQWNAMAVVNDYNADWPLEFYRFFRDELSCQFLQFTPIVERILHDNGSNHLACPKDAVAELAPFSISPSQWGDFLCAVFDEWVRRDVGKVFVQLFDATLANWVGQSPSVCSMGKECGHALVMEANGDVYSCDHFVFPQYKLGNIKSKTFMEMLSTPEHKEFEKLKNQSLPRQCKECKWNFACHGECPKNRFTMTKDGEPGLNYLCEGYRKFFEHVAPYMDFMANEIQNKRPPANVMTDFKL